mgnify:CR=1 FL=1
MKTNGKERDDVSDAKSVESRLRQLEILSWWIQNRCEEVGGEILEDPETESGSLITLPNSPETQEQVQRIAGMIQVFDMVLTKATEGLNDELADENGDSPSSTDSTNDSADSPQGLDPLFGENKDQSTSSDRGLDPLFASSGGGVNETEGADE